MLYFAEHLIFSPNQVSESIQFLLSSGILKSKVGDEHVY